MEERAEQLDYPALESYRDEAVVSSYEETRFSGRLGRYRWRREQDGVGAMVAMLPAEVSVLDCPCGIGRWWPLLATRARSIHGVDLSDEMLAAARARAEREDVPVQLGIGNAESLEFDAGSFDVVFSHALTKHLPLAVQQRVLSEFARVASGFVLSSFSLVNHVTYEAWRRRGLRHSYPLLSEQLAQFADAAGLEEVSRRRCTTPIGVEHSVLFRKRD